MRPNRMVHMVILLPFAIAGGWGCQYPTTLRCESDPIELDPSADLFSEGAGLEAIAVAATVEDQESGDLLLSVHETTEEFVYNYRKPQPSRYPWLDDTWLPAGWPLSSLISEDLCRGNSTYVDFGFSNPFDDPERKLSVGRYPLGGDPSEGYGYLRMAVGEMDMDEPEAQGDLVVTEITEDERVSGYLDGTVSGWMLEPFDKEPVGWVEIQGFAFRGLLLESTEPGLLEP